MFEGPFHSPNALNAEHLKEGIRPITASVGGTAEKECWQTVETDPVTKETIELIKKGAENVEYGPPFNLSALSEQDKFSEEYSECTGVVLVGKDKTIGRELSLLSHQNPQRLSGAVKDQFAGELISRLDQLIEASEPGTIDVVLFGGHTNTEEQTDQYEESIRSLSEICKSRLGFEPAVIVGPNADVAKARMNVYLDTQHRRLYIVRPDQAAEAKPKWFGLKKPKAGEYNEADNATNQSFLPSEFKKAKRSWGK